MPDYETDSWEEDYQPLKLTALDRRIFIDLEEVDEELQRLKSKLTDELI